MAGLREISRGDRAPEESHCTQALGNERAWLMVENAMGVSMDLNPFCNALSEQAQKVVELLMRYGADPHVKDRFGRGILHHARSAMTVSWMAGQGAAIDGRDALGQTPLLFAMLDDVKQKSFDREQALIELVVRGAQLDSSDHQGTVFSSSPEKLLASKSKSYSQTCRWSSSPWTPDQGPMLPWMNLTILRLDSGPHPCSFVRLDYQNDGHCEDGEQVQWV